MTGSTLRLNAGDTVRIRNERWVVLQESRCGDVSLVDVRGMDKLNRGTRARFLLPFERLESEEMSRAPRIVRPPEWRVLARSHLARVTPRVDSLRAAATANIDVLSYQLEPALAITAGRSCRLLIADEVGLGKTVQAGLIIAEQLHRLIDARALVVCPAGLRQQWQDELRHRFNLVASVIDGSTTARAVMTVDRLTNPWTTASIAIASIDFIKRAEVMRALEGLIWDVLVLDEAHNLATQSDRATAAAALAWRARTVVMLTATPHSGDDAAFARLCGLGDVGNRFPLTLFRRTRADAGLPVARRAHWLTVEPTNAEKAMHAALLRYAHRVWRDPQAEAGARLAISVLMRRAASSASSLARSVARRLVALGEWREPPMPQLALPFAPAGDDDEPVGALAGRGLGDWAEEGRELEQLLSLARRASTAESKVSALERWLRRVREPAIVFTEYRDTLTHLREALERRGLLPGRLAELHGGLTRRERSEALRQFAEGRCDVMLATDAASEGLNLHHHCRCVVSLEVPWSPVRLEQRAGRVDRIGQRRRVHALHFVGAHTIETDIVRRVRERGRHAERSLRCDEATDLTIAGDILTGVVLTAVSPPAPRTVHIRRAHVLEAAGNEASRIESTRCLGRGPTTNDERPFATAIRRRDHK
jgi:superfamily II DNA or RNA helicase